MEIFNEIKSRVINITTVDSEKFYYPSYKIRIELKTEEISAIFNRSIWLSEADIDTFISDLRSLDETRNGIARLESMSPNEFILKIKNIDTLGHLAVNLVISHKNRLYSDYSDSIEIEFEIEPSSILRIVSDLKLFKD